MLANIQFTVFNFPCYVETPEEPRQLSRYSDGLQAGQPAFNSRQGQEIFFYFTASRQALWPTLSAVQLVLGLKQPGRESDYTYI
jgi:hypothetical protein